MNTRLFLKAVVAMAVAIVPFQKAIAQYSTERFNTVNCKGIWDRAIGRAADGVSRIVSYHEIAGGEFHLTDISDSTTFHFDVPVGMYVNDLEVYNDTVFFCGRYYGRAMVGLFPLEAFAYGFYPIGTVLPYVAPPYPVSISFDYYLFPEEKNMTHLEVYTSPVDGRTTVAAVGETWNSLSDVYTSLYIISLGGSTISYQEFGTNTIPYGVFQDVAVTDNYIVTTGVYPYSSSDCITMTFVDKSNTGTLHPYFYDEPAGVWPVPILSIEHLQEDEVAISSLVYNGSSSPYSISLHVYDVPSLTFTHSQTVSVLEKDAPSNKMLYFHEDSTLLLLHTNLYPDLSAVSSAIYTLLPYATANYMTNTIYNKDSSFNSLDRFQDFRFVATGHLTDLQHSFFIHDRQASFQSSCFLSNSHKVSVANTPTNNQFFSPNNYTYTTTVITEYPTVTEETLKINCQSN